MDKNTGLFKTKSSIVQLTIAVCGVLVALFAVWMFNLYLLTSFPIPLRMAAADLSDGIGRSGIMKQLFAREEDFIRSQLARCTGTSNRIKCRLHFRRYWKKQNAKL